MLVLCYCSLVQSKPSGPGMPPAAERIAPAGSGRVGGAVKIGAMDSSGASCRGLRRCTCVSDAMRNALQWRWAARMHGYLMQWHMAMHRARPPVCGGPGDVCSQQCGRLGVARGVCTSSAAASALPWCAQGQPQGPGDGAPSAQSLLVRRAQRHMHEGGCVCVHSCRLAGCGCGGV